MKISIVGAGGEVARTLASHLLRGGLLGHGDSLQLVGHGALSSERRLLAVRVDLLDGFDEAQPEIEVVSSLDAIEGDVIVMAAGATLSPDRPTRRDLAGANRPLFEDFARSVAARGTGREVVVVVSNPVELAVETLCRQIDRHRVLGMGAQQDSLRFSRAIAEDLGVHRNRVHAWVLGEHGAAIVPVWSGVQLLGVNEEQSRQQIARLRGEAQRTDFDARVVSAQGKVRRLMAEEQIAASYQAVHALPPDLRIVLEPFITCHCLHTTANATANATCDVVRALTTARDSLVGAQVQLRGEVHDLHTVCGLPVVVNATGWSSVVCPPLDDEERAHLGEVADTISGNLASWLA